MKTLNVTLEKVTTGKKGRPSMRIVWPAGEEFTAEDILGNLNVPKKPSIATVQLKLAEAVKEGKLVSSENNNVRVYKVA
jgi:predicted transcriptional regulator